MTATPSEEPTTAQRATKRKGIIAVGIIALLLATLFFGMFNAMQTARAQVDTLKEQLEACGKKPSPPPSLPAAPAPATGNGSCDKQETHATICCSSKPSASQPVKKKAPPVDKPAAPASKPGATTSATFWGWVHPFATVTNKKPCYADRTITDMPARCSQVIVEPSQKDETEDAWRTRVAAKAGIAVGNNGITGTKNSDVKVN